VRSLKIGPLLVAKAICVLFALSGLQSTLVGLVGVVVFLVPLTALVVELRKYEQFSAELIAIYWIWVLYDLAWTYQSWRLNGTA
jgi:tryptophan-rich sensory protein